VALMRGATKTRGAALPEKALTQLATAAPDNWVRRKAAEGAATIAQRRASRAKRPPTLPLTPAQQALFEAGKVTYGLCAACHQPDGLGRSDLAPSFKEGPWINAVSPDASIRIVLNGKQGTAGFAAPMAPLAGLSDEQIAGVLTFVRRSFGNNAPAVDPEMVELVRRRVGAKRATPWTDAELGAGINEAP
jgi:mono/diheme cytochrome c family protein